MNGPEKLILAGALFLFLLLHALGRREKELVDAIRAAVLRTPAPGESATLGPAPAAPAIDLSPLIAALAPERDNFERLYLADAVARVDTDVRPDRKLNVYMMFLHSDGAEVQDINFWEGTTLKHAARNVAGTNILPWIGVPWYRCEPGKSFGIEPLGGKRLNGVVLYKFEV